jgi:hypothetical protein
MREEGILDMFVLKLVEPHEGEYETAVRMKAQGKAGIKPPAKVILKFCCCIMVLWGQGTPGPGERPEKFAKRWLEIMKDCLKWPEITEVQSLPKGGKEL